MATAARPTLAAANREITGKAVNRLRKEGRLPAVVFGHGLDSASVSLDTHDFEQLRKHVGPNALIDLSVGGEKSVPVLVQHVQVHPVNRRPLHVDLFAVRMTEELIVDVPLVATGESLAVTQLGGTLLHPNETVKVRALPDHLPQSLSYSIESLADFDGAIKVSDLEIPGDVTLLTELDEVIATVQRPRIEVEEVPEVEEEEGVEGAEGAEGEGAGARAAEAPVGRRVRRGELGPASPGLLPGRVRDRRLEQQLRRVEAAKARDQLPLESVTHVGLERVREHLLVELGDEAGIGLGIELVPQVGTLGGHRVEPGPAQAGGRRLDRAQVPGTRLRRRLVAVVALLDAELIEQVVQDLVRPPAAAVGDPRHVCEHAARTQHAPDLAQRAEAVRHELEHERRHHGVERVVRERELVREGRHRLEATIRARERGGGRLRGGNHLARRIDRVHLRFGPALQGGERQRPGSGPDVQQPEAAAVESLFEPVEERPGARRDHRRPPARVALRDPVVAFGLVGHRGMVPRPGEPGWPVSRPPPPVARSGRPDPARRTAGAGTRRCRLPRRT